MSRSKRVLLLGGTGAMGVYLVPELLKLGYEVYVTSRSSRTSDNGSLKFIRGDAKSDDFVAELLKKDKYDAVIDFMVYHTEEFERRVDLLLNNTEHYIFLSSYRVYAGSELPIKEDSPRLLDTVDDPVYIRTDEYGLAKARQEDVLSSKGKTHWTVVRPAITYSRDRFQLGTMEANEFLHRTLTGKEVIFPSEMIDKKTTMTWAGDVARMIAKIVLNKSTFGESYTAATSESLTWREVIDTYRKTVDLKIKLVPLGDYERIIGRHYQIKYDRMYDRVIDNKKILSITKIKQTQLKSLEDGLGMELAGFIKDPVFQKIDQDKDRRMDQLLLLGRSKEDIRSRVKSKLRVVKRFIRSKQEYDGAILSLGGYYNYGGLIQRYALQTFLRKSGYNFKVFNVEYMRKYGKKEGDRRNLEKFASSYVDEEVFNPLLGSLYKTYIVGSDQVWRDWFGGNWEKFGNFFLRFVKNPKANRIAYAASFGVDDLASAGINARNKKKITTLIRKFNSISVREESAIRLVEQLKGSAVTCIDPSLLLTGEDYSKLVDSSPKVKKTAVTSIFSYLLDPTSEKESAVKTFEKLMKSTSTDIRPRNGKQLPPMELWLKCFRDTELVVTDSFHGIAFSIINRKQFVVFGNRTRGLARMTDLLGPLGLSDRLIVEEDLSSVDLKDLMKPIDWKSVEKVLDKKRKESSDWLLGALS